MKHTNRNHQNQFFKERLNKVNHVLTKLEGEIEKTVKNLRKKSEKSSQVLRKNFDEVMEKISGSQFYSMATEKTEGFTREVKRLADDIVGRVCSMDFSATENLLADIQKNVEVLVERFQNVALVERAKDKAVHTGKQVLQALDIPTQDDLAKLSQKVGVLEKKLKTISKKAA